MPAGAFSAFLATILHPAPFVCLVSLPEVCCPTLFPIGVTSPNGNLCTLRVPQGSQVSLDDVLAEIPNVVTREIDVLPAQRG